MKEIYEYELLNIEWHLNYEFDYELIESMVRDDNRIEYEEKKESPQLTFDDQGIPLGTSSEAFKLRQQIITEFWVHLKEKYPELKDRRIFNENLNEYIYIVHYSFDEAIVHSANTYLSTKAFLRLEEILAKARPVARVATKPDDKNQRNYSQMLIMTYELEKIGRIKIVVGISKKNFVEGIPRKEEYATIAMADGQKLIEKPKKEGRKKKAHR